MDVGRLGRSFGAAWQGMVSVSRTQLSWRIQVAAGGAAAAAGLAAGLTGLEWGLLGLTIGIVLALEAMNSAVEAAVDALDGPPSAAKGSAKDAAAAGVLIASLAAVAVGVAIFGPRLASIRLW